MEMRAIAWTAYGSPDVLQLRMVEKPTPERHEILIKIHAASVIAGDCEMRRLQLPLGFGFPMRLYTGFLKPKRVSVLGQEFAGEIEAAGSAVRSFQKGDQVFGTVGFRFGAYAEYICLPGDLEQMLGVLATIPANLTYVEAATVPTSALEALHFLKAAAIQPGRRVMIIGAGGSIGTFSVQLARHFGAEVTVVDATDKLEMLRAIGANHLIDYTKENYGSQAGSYDLIIDVVGGRSVKRRLKLLQPEGIYYLANARISHVFLGRWVALTSKRKLKIDPSSQKQADFLFLKGLIEKGQLKPIIDCTFPLEQTAAAHEYAESGKKQGNIVIQMMR
jgi:NADPH:quinone reductase-like Zn-dependent oxidoreductase